jgi:hypothetical protein
MALHQPTKGVSRMPASNPGSPIAAKVSLQICKFLQLSKNDKEIIRSHLLIDESIQR